MKRDALSTLSENGVIALVLAQSDVIARQTMQIELLVKRVETLEAKLGQPSKTPDNSSMPPSQGQEVRGA